MAGASGRPRPTSVGRNIAAARERRGWTISDLAHHADVLRPTISRIESGVIPNPGGYTLKRIAEALGESLDRLLDTRPTPHPVRLSVSLGNVVGAPVVELDIVGADRLRWADRGRYEWVASPSGGSGPRLLALEVADARYGDIIQPGDTVVFDASDQPLGDGTLALLVIDAAVAFGRARGDQMEDEHGVILLPERYRVVGAVLRVIRDPNAATLIRITER